MTSNKCYKELLVFEEDRPWHSTLNLKREINYRSVENCNKKKYNGLCHHAVACGIVTVDKMARRFFLLLLFFGFVTIPQATAS